MNMKTPQDDQPSTPALIARLWREHVRHYRGRIALIIVTTLIMSAATALYPAIIDWAFTMFAHKDARILYQVPILVLIVTVIKGLSMYFQAVLTQDMVLLVIRRLQVTMFGHLTNAALARVEREAPAQLAARFTTDATVVRDAMTRAVNAVADAATVVGLVVTMIYHRLEAEPHRGFAVSGRGDPGAEDRQAHAPRLGRHAGAHGRGRRHARPRASPRPAPCAPTGWRRTSRPAPRPPSPSLQALIRMTRAALAAGPMLEVLAGVAVALVIGFEGWRNATGDSSVGNFIGFVSALLIASRPLRALGTMNAAMQEGFAGLVRVFKVIDEPPPSPTPPAPSRCPPGRRGGIRRRRLHLS